MNRIIRVTTFASLRTANLQRAELWNPGPGPCPDNYGELLFRSNELGGECGEAQNKVKKYARYLKGRAGGVDFEQSRKDIADELADTIICCDRVAEMFDIDLAKAVKDKFNKTSDKHGFNVKL